MRIVLQEDRVVVVEKDGGVTSEDAARFFERKLVHRIDKDTSGLLILADDARTVQRMQRALREGGVERTYLVLANGVVSQGKRETTLVRDRGDGLRGSGVGGKHATLHVESCVTTTGATLAEVKLVTGRTHQIRIQLAEEGHPVVGERVYVRDARAAGIAVMESPRLMLHAARLRFVQPNNKRVVEVESPLPKDFVDMLTRLALQPRVRAMSC